MNPMQNQMQELDNILRVKLEGVEFPKEEVKPLFSEFLNHLLENSSLSDFKCDLGTYQKIIDDSKKSLYAMSFIINRFFEMTPNKLNAVPNGYLEILNEVSQMSAYWNKQVDPIHKKIQKDFATRQSLSLSVNQKNKMVNPNLRVK